MSCLVKAVLAWVAFLFIGTNLLGFVIRGLLWSVPRVEAPDECVAGILGRETRRMRAANLAVTSFFVVLTAAYLLALWYMRNVSLAASAGMVMIARLPDLLWEIRTGEKVSMAHMPKGIAAIIAALLTWLALPLAWFALCYWPCPGI